ncbi:hypothetical protein B0T21DRAFT_380249 [Apiosordaria backusii]|uniref:Uncharacterized protein n=1 Tax=Apiosordaria backusii TaxID=314023 RepID=A0AA40K724_9PEZI|nr:hypothetical protein B0T21DRAFT_380249 [Apiosordaria backusii]
MSPPTDTVPTGPILTAPPPWNTKATMYLIPFWTSSRTAANLPEKAYHPFEYQSSFSSPQASGKPLGGLSMVQIIRYHSTPVGPYDELILCPGTFEYPLPDSQHEAEPTTKKKTGKAMRITRIYVSQKYTCWNGRKLWNLPKHLAHFIWSTPDPSNPEIQTLRVYPHDHSPPGGVPYNPAEPTPSTTPFFKCTLKVIPYLPSFPFSNLWLPKMGIDVSLVQPPLPENSQASQGELPGTSEWVKMGGYEQVSKRCKVMWADLNQKEDGEEGKGEDNFFPGLKRWNLGVVMEDGEANFVEGERWAAPRHTL